LFLTEKAQENVLRSDLGLPELPGFDRGTVKEIVCAGAERR
jgi:hypothetical protein